MLPNSGIIYATRDDALPDLSDNTLLSDGSSDNNTQALVSPTDFKLDSTRRPNGIRLVNGSNLARNNSYRVAEKGLILATNLPTYIKGDFNLHKDPSSSTAREEFTSTLNTDWSNFYTRSQNGGSLDPNFACRQNQTGCGGSGDQWRTATIISDAQTLLSNQFWDGFRNEGDYDLSNNQGNSAASSRLKQGFWNNNFVTSANWDNSSGYPNNYYSYLTNGVTPIQRQVNNFPEYIMEVCPILPVSECKPKNLPANNKPTDWVVGYDINGNGTLDDSVTFDVGSDGDTSNDKEKFIKADQLGQALVASGKTDGGDGILINTEVNWSTPYGTTNKSPLDRLGAGTTARLALLTADQRYARRVAFARRNQFDTLVFTSIGTGTSTKYAAKPLGVGCPLDTSSTKPENSGCQYPSTSSWAAGTHYGNPANNTNALWFRTTTNIVGNPGDLATGSYNTNFPLYYSSPNPVVDTKVMLPNTPDIQGATGLITLNGTGTTDPSDFTMCLTGSGTGSGYSQEYLVSAPSSTCPMGNINSQVTQLLALTPTGTLTIDSIVPSKLSATANTSNNVNVYQIPSGTPNFNSGATITLNGNADSIFIFQGGNDVNFGSTTAAAGITLNLNGVSPNNIFWVSNGSLEINDAIGKPHKLAGNFIGRSSYTLKIGANTQIIGGRFLNFSKLSSTIPASSNVYATSVDQPSLAPLLQIHSPTGTPGGTPFNGEIKYNWVQTATTTTANVALITGDSPSRPNPSESNGGLNNFVRFVENWENQTARIKGSLIQFQRSAIATGPFYPVDLTVTDSSGSLFYTLNGSGMAPYLQNLGYTGFRYRGGVFAFRASYYYPPTRAYGFDVAILSQSPDLFAQRFTVEPTNPPNEYFREIGRDDSWTQTLLCAAEASDRVGGTGATYTTPAIPDRASTCPINLPYPTNP